VILYALVTCALMSDGSRNCSLSSGLPLMESQQLCQLMALQIYPDKQFVKGRMYLSDRLWLECWHKEVEVWQP
jgi:hypothetical protein